jgi:hypothetical protein
MTTATTTATTMPVSEYLYDARLQLTQFTEYGVSLADLNSGRTTPPPEGTHIDIAFEGEIEGERLRGAMRGIDYLYVRADGRFELNIHAEIATPDGAKIALQASGVALPDATRPGVVQIRENVQLTSHDPRYSWVNRLQVWITGSADMGTGRLLLHAFAA